MAGTPIHPFSRRPDAVTAPPRRRGAAFPTHFCLVLAILLVARAGARLEGAETDTITGRQLARAFSLQYQRLRGADDSTVGAVLTGGEHKVILLDGLSAVNIDGDTVRLDRPIRAAGADVNVPAGLVTTLRGLFDVPPGPEQRAVIVIDPGHGGRDPGAIGRYFQTREKDINLAVSLRVVELLRAAGITVHLTRDSDVHVELEARAALANRVKADLFVSIHTNATDNTHATGFLTLYPADSWEKAELGSVVEKARESAHTPGRVESRAGITGTLPAAARLALSTAMMEEYQVRSLEAAELIGRGLQNRAQTHQRGPVPDFRGLRVLRKTHCPAVLVELDFLTNRRAEQRLRTEAFLEKLARGVSEGVFNYVTRHVAGAAE